MANSAARREAAAILRRLLAMADAGDIEADTPRDRAIRSRLEGAAIALEESLH
jgi:hypothetical protein